MRIYDITQAAHELAPQDLPLCPLCDDPIMRSHGDTAIAAYGDSLCLVHDLCAEELDAPWREGGEP